MSIEKYIGNAPLNEKVRKPYHLVIKDGAINFSKLDAELQSLITNAKGNINTVDITKDTKVLDFGLSSNQSSESNEEIYSEIEEGMYMVIDNSHSSEEETTNTLSGAMLLYKNAYNNTLSEVLISNYSITESTFTGLQDGTSSIKHRVWNKATNKWAEWQDLIDLKAFRKESNAAYIHNKEGAITTSLISTGAITTDKIADNSITSEKILNGTIMGHDIHNAAIGRKQLMNEAVGTDTLANKSVTAPKLEESVYTTINEYVGENSRIPSEEISSIFFHFDTFDENNK